MVAQPPHRGVDSGLAGGHRAALAGRHDLARVEGEAGGHTERAAGRSAVAGPQGAGGVFEERHLLRHRGLQRLPLDRAAEEVYCHDRARPRGHGSRNRARVEVERVWIDVDQHRARAAELDDVRRGREGVRRHDDLVTRSDLEREQREVERSGARRDRGSVCRADRVCECSLELLHLRAHRELAALDHSGDGSELSGADVGPREPNRVSHAVRAPSFSRYHAIVRSSPSSRSTLASKPSNVRALSMLGILSSTSM